MNASKENCQLALDAIDVLGIVAGRTCPAQIDFLRDFLLITLKRLPTERALAEDRTRRRRRPSPKAETRGRGLSAGQHGV